MEGIKTYELLTDAEINTRILSGEYSLYEIIIRRYNPYLYKVGRSYGFNHHDTEDLMQDTYLSAYTCLNKFQSRSSFKTWLVKIMLNHCYHKKNKAGYKREFLFEDQLNESISLMLGKEADTNKAIINKELGRAMEVAIRNLPEQYRLVFSLRELNEMSTAETAEALSITESNVKVRLNRAKAMLRKEIEKMYSAADIFEFNAVFCDKIVDRVMSRIMIG